MSDTVTIDVPKKLLAMDLISVFELLKKYPIVTRKLLLIRPLRSEPHVTKEEAQGDKAMNVIACDFKKKAEAADWQVFDLKGNNATKTSILNMINTQNPDFVVYFGHSLNTYIPGQKNDKLELAITPSNISLLANRTASVTACLTLSSIGIPATKAGIVAYLGYKALFSNWFTVHLVTGELLSDSELDVDWRGATNAANTALLNGALYKDAKDIGYKKWIETSNKWQAKYQSNPQVGPLIASSALSNANGLDFVGKSNAVARPIGILITTP